MYSTVSMKNRACLSALTQKHRLNLQLFEIEVDATKIYFLVTVNPHKKMKFDFASRFQVFLKFELLDFV